MMIYFERYSSNVVKKQKQKDCIASLTIIVRMHVQLLLLDLRNISVRIDAESTVSTTAQLQYILCLQLLILLISSSLFSVTTTETELYSLRALDHWANSEQNLRKMRIP